MKKLISLIIVCAIFSFSACAQSKTKKGSEILFEYIDSIIKENIKIGSLK